MICVACSYRHRESIKRPITAELREKNSELCDGMEAKCLEFSSSWSLAVWLQPSTIMSDLFQILRSVVGSFPIRPDASVDPQACFHCLERRTLRSILQVLCGRVYSWPSIGHNRHRWAMSEVSCPFHFFVLFWTTTA
jgi:hypothetical protein